MINIDFLTFKKFLDENIDFLIGSRLQKIRQPTRRDFLFSLRNNGESRKLYININPQFYHPAFITDETEKRRNIVFPPHPPMFCMLLRKYLEGCRISDALVVENERILELHFDTTDEFSQNRSLCLCAEFMGKHSNVILYDRETSLIIGCAHNVGSEKSSYRELKGGLKYVYPPEVNSREKVKIPLYQLLAGQYENSVSVNKMLDDYYSKIQEEINLKSEKSSLTVAVLPQLKKVKNSISKISALLQKRDNTDKYKLYGELLTANLYQKSDFQPEIEVFDYNSGKNIIIELDKAKNLKDNAQKYFKLYTKSKATKEKSGKILENLNIEKDYLENILYSIDISKTLNELEEIKAELKTETGKSQKPVKSGLTELKIKSFDVYIGKNNKQNDYIVSKLARDEDLWFHTKLCAGSHVLLRVNETKPDEDVILECCKLAREYSSASSRTGVIYTKAKYLKKPPAAPLGYVTYRNEKEVLV